MGILRANGWLCGVILTACLTSASASAPVQPPTVNIDEAVLADWRRTLEHPLVLMWLDNRNAARRDYSPAQIAALDERWAAERAAGFQPQVASMLSNPVSNFLTKVQANSVGLFMEILLADTHGLNAGSTHISEDYYQADEAWFTEAFGQTGTGGWLGEIEYDDVFHVWRATISFPLDGAPSTPPAGVVRGEVNLTELQRRNQM